jgi:putative MATE family efflux protein
VASRAWGAGERNDVKRIATDSLVLGLVVVLIITAIGYASLRPLFSALGASGEVMEFAIDYMRIWYLSVPLLVIPQIANALLRAGGDSVVPSAIMVLAAVVNAILDPLLILGLWGFPRLEIIGAAWASFGVRAVTLVVSISVLVFRDKLIEFVWPGLQAVAASWKRIIKVAIPAAFGSSINPIGVSIVTALLSGFAASTVAGFGVATRIEAFAAIPMFALSAAIGPIAGQNWTSNNRDRVMRSLVQSYVFCIGWSVIIGIALWLSADLLARQFTDDDAVASEVATYLKIVPFSLAGYGIVVEAAGCFNAIDLARRSLVFYLARSAVLYVPLSYLATLLSGPSGVYTAIAVANVVAGVVTAVLSLRWLAHQNCRKVPDWHCMLNMVT